MRCTNGFAKDEVAEPRLTKTPHYPRHMPRCIFEKVLNAWQRKDIVPSVRILFEYAIDTTSFFPAEITLLRIPFTSVKAIVFQKPYDQTLE